ncbi:MAG: hypothetical protein H6867_04290 [Rhodospirillales bacterium]|nr:hypothetical protein [Rhodospirillales bacterium]MCB9996369.1 hypothetical protein [Rhodospirillales bacterium]
MGEDNRSRIFELKQRLLRRAWDGESSLAANGAEMILLIQMRMAQCQPTKGFHEFALEETRLLDDDQPRSVRMLNTLARYNEEKTRYSKTDGKTLH